MTRVDRGRIDNGLISRLFTLMAAFRPKTVTIHSQIYDGRPRSPYLRLLLPIARLKQLFQIAYDLLLSLLWREFTTRHRVERMLIPVILVAFGSLSLLVYYSRDYDLPIFAALLAIWSLDVYLARRQYAQGEPHHRLTLKVEADQANLQLDESNGRQRCSQFMRTQVLQLEIRQAAVRGGIFRERLGWVWRVYLVLRDRSQCLVYEKQQAIAAFRGAKQLSRQFFDAPIIFIDSEGISEGLGGYAAEYLSDDLKAQIQTSHPDTLIFDAALDQWHLRTRWRLKSFVQMVGEIVQKSGFLLFLVILANVMAFVGSILHATVITSFAQPIDADLVLNTVGFELDLPDLIEGLFALALIVFRGVRISQEKRVWITPEQTTVYLDRRQRQLQTQAIETAVYIKSPRPCLLMCDRQSEILLEGLQSERDFRALLVLLETGISHFRAAQSFEETGDSSQSV
ncbi:MAG: hypothetical protein AAF728_01765 [Cyanobacteria bacterium P01_D01_bin.128]